MPHTHTLAHAPPQGLFPPSVRVDNLRPYSLAVKYLDTDASLKWDPVVVAANETCVELAQDVRVRVCVVCVVCVRVCACVYVCCVCCVR